MERKNAVVVTLISGDGDLADLLEYLSKYDEFTQQHLLTQASEWMRLGKTGPINVDSIRMDLTPAQTDLPHPAHSSEYPKGT